MGIRTVSTKAQDGPQHPGADALEVVRPLADATDGDVYIYMTDIHRGFPYEWPGDTPEEKLDTFVDKIATQVDQVLDLPAEYQDNVVFVPFNEPEGNMFGTGRVELRRHVVARRPDGLLRRLGPGARADQGPDASDARIAGPNTSILYGQVKGFLEHTVEAGTVPGRDHLARAVPPGEDPRVGGDLPRHGRPRSSPARRTRAPSCRSTSTSTRSTTTPPCPAR